MISTALESQAAVPYCCRERSLMSSRLAITLSMEALCGKASGLKRNGRLPSSGGRRVSNSCYLKLKSNSALAQTELRRLLWANIRGLFNNSIKLREIVTRHWWLPLASDSACLQLYAAHALACSAFVANFSIFNGYAAMSQNSKRWSEMQNIVKQCKASHLSHYLQELLIVTDCNPTIHESRGVPA